MANSLTHRYTVYILPARVTDSALHAAGIEHADVFQRLVVEASEIGMMHMVQWMGTRPRIPVGTEGKMEPARIEIWRGLQLTWEIAHGVCLWHGMRTRCPARKLGNQCMLTWEHDGAHVFGK